MRILALIAVALGLAACGPTVQTTSGRDYLDKYDRALARSGAGPAVPVANGLDGAIRQAAAVEPLLTLPARFGLARIVNGRITAIPGREAELWAEFAERYARAGEFIPISPLIAEYTADAVAGGARNAVETVRLGAARQHVDAVLLYEVGARGSNVNTVLAIADLTIIGAALLPTRRLGAEGVAQALLLDVRNGYPYGTASAQTALSEYSTSFGSSLREEDLRDRAVADVVEALIPQVDIMMRDLLIALAADETRNGS